MGYMIILAVQFTIFVTGVIINIYWRSEGEDWTTSNKISFFSQNKCDLIFLIYFLIELASLMEIILLKSFAFLNKLLFFDFSLRICIVCISYAILLSKKSFFFILFAAIMVYVPLRMHAQENDITSIAQFPFTLFTLTLIVFGIRFRLLHSLDNAYKSIIHLYRDIVNDLCLRISSSPTLQFQHALAE